MGALAWVGHGGLAGAAVELLAALAVVGLLGAVWLRERRPENGVSDDGTE